MQIANREQLERHSCECYGRVRTYVAKLFAGSKFAASESANSVLASRSIGSNRQQRRAEH
jgi:hypothetical protein